MARQELAGVLSGSAARIARNRKSTHAVFLKHLESDAISWTYCGFFLTYRGIRPPLISSSMIGSFFNYDDHSKAFADLLKLQSKKADDDIAHDTGIAHLGESM